MSSTIEGFWSLLRSWPRPHQVWSSIGTSGSVEVTGSSGRANFSLILSTSVSRSGAGLLSGKWAD